MVIDSDDKCSNWKAKLVSNGHENRGELTLTEMNQIVVAGNWVRGRRTVDIDRPQTQAHGHYAGRNMGIRSNRLLTFHETILYKG
jgi:hypothetical protein